MLWQKNSSPQFFSFLKRRLLTAGLLLLSLNFTNCLQTENSSSVDTTITGSPEFLAARTVLVNNCINCHIGHDFHLLYEEDFIERGYVEPGDFLNSPIYYRLEGSLGSEGPKNMPEGGTLSASDIQTIQVWLETLSP